MRVNAVVACGDDEETVRSDPNVRDGDLVYPIGLPPSGFYLLNV